MISEWPQVELRGGREQFGWINFRRGTMLATTRYWEGTAFGNLRNRR
jgi:hypothetical protein